MNPFEWYLTFCKARLQCWRPFQCENGFLLCCILLGKKRRQPKYCTNLLCRFVKGKIVKLKHVGKHLIIGKWQFFVNTSRKVKKSLTFNMSLIQTDKKYIEVNNFLNFFCRKSFLTSTKVLLNLWLRFTLMRHSHLLQRWKAFWLICKWCMCLYILFFFTSSNLFLFPLLYVILFIQ